MQKFKITLGKTRQPDNISFEISATDAELAYDFGVSMAQTLKPGLVWCTKQERVVDAYWNVDEVTSLES